MTDTIVMTDAIVVAADHPSLDDQVGTFVATLREEPRYFGPAARRNPKPFPSLLAELQQHGGFRLASMEHGRITGLVRVDELGVVHIAVAAEHRGHGTGSLLLQAAISRAAQLCFGRLVLHATHRSRAVRRLGDRLGCTTVDLGRGRLDLILPVPTPAALPA
ncbi:MAG: GNAT family N-acetyltransferase [Ilumatobacteraceae bacterium]|nr:GNAT family N-acetyltransferase [Ilumatobacteraceae bacterium]